MYKYNNSEARFAELEEVKVATKQVDITNDHFRAGGLPIRSDGKNVWVDDDDVRTLTIASSGSGKTRRVMMPMLITLAKSGSSLVINDPKGELLAQTYNLLDTQGYEIKVINCKNPLQGNCYNVFHPSARLYKRGNIAKATEYFYEFAVSLFEAVKSEKDPYWTNMSENYLTGLCLLACELMNEGNINLQSIYDLHVAGNERIAGTTCFGEYFERKGNKNSEVYRLMEGTLNAPRDTTQASIFSVFTQVMSRLVANADMIDLLSGTMDWDIEDIGRKKMAVFLLSKDEGTFYSSIITAIVQQIYVVLINLADTKFQGRLPQRVEFIMDEFGNMAKIQDINQKISASRSRNMRWHLCIQSLEQLWLRYSKEEAKIILSNCDDWIYMYSTDIDLVRHISARCGDKICEYTGEKNPLLSVSALQHFDKEQGECLVLQGRNYPFITYLPDISQYSCQYPIFDINKIPYREIRKKEQFDFRELVKKERERFINDMLGGKI